MQIHDLTQGSPEWHQFRLEHFGASEAAAMLGLSKKVKRNELLQMKKTGSAKEFSDWVQKNILDYGHEVEALARPIIEAQLGEDLYPVTCSLGRMSASCDGLTMSGEIAFEHKQWNEQLAQAVAAGNLPEEYMPQCQQIMLVTGATMVVFVVSDGTSHRMAQIFVSPSVEWFERLRAGWAQFEEDLKHYTPSVAEPEAVGRTPESLPALRIEVTGLVTASNLGTFRDHALSVIGSINRRLETDQDFADAEKTVKWCGDVESRLAAAKQHALSQTESIDTLFRMIDEISAEARATRLELDKLVKARKEQLRNEIFQEGVLGLQMHITSLNQRLGKSYMPSVPADFAGAMKGKKTVASLKDAVATTLANVKIEANAIADRIQANLTLLREQAKDYAFLFADAEQLVQKSADDFATLVSFRIDAHKKTEEARLAADRDRIAAEERARAEATLQAQARVELPSTAAPAPTPAATVVPITSHAPTLRLGHINERLGFTVTTDFLTGIGFAPAATDKNAKLYHDADFPRICAAIAQHLSAIARQFSTQLAA
jgi:predicted phage-related endonuclease